MEVLKCSEIIKATGGRMISGSADTEFGNIIIDSRKISQGELFVPIVGERFDGHSFINSSLEAGAAGTLTQKEIDPVPGKVIILVEDTVKALGAIAAYYRQKFDIPIVGITGSVGKTSTKDMVSSAMGQALNILKTEGNFNNEIGLPLTIFNLESTHEAGVIEMGMSGFGEISRLTAIAKPSVAIITNIGMSHIEKLGSRENILKAKLEILEGLNDGGLVVLNGDDEFLACLKDTWEFRTVLYGLGENADYRAFNIRSMGEEGTYFDVEIGHAVYNVHVNAPGVHNVHNALAAIAAGIELKVPIEIILKGIEQFTPGKMRLNIMSFKGCKIINDSYNASPNSMEAALQVLKDIGSKGRTIAVLGDMLEMGQWAYQAHYDVGKYAINAGIDYIITVGTNGRSIAKGAMESGAGRSSVYSFDDNMKVIAFLKKFLSVGDTILVKGSRGMKMEQIVNGLENDN